MKKDNIKHMKISINEIQILRDRTGVGVVDAKSALEKSG